MTRLLETGAFTIGYSGGVVHLIHKNDPHMKFYIQKADIPELLAALLFVTEKENVSHKEIEECCEKLGVKSPL